MKAFQQSTTMALNSVVGAAVNSESCEVTLAGGLAAVSNITVDANTAKALGSITSNAITITGHSYKSGLVGQVSNSGGALPTGISGSTNYYVIVIDANTVKLATSYANAVAGTAITCSGGSGTNTFTPTALAGATIQPQWSLDGSVWFPVAAATSVTASTVFSYEKDRPAYRYFRFAYAITTGSLTVANVYNTYRD